ncbi:MAG: hypothetical protein V2I27_12885 [Erythrobacter sp.]|jgi:hypothetical protein|nr:hypothetical protein [Erythrobacter sp.]
MSATEIFFIAGIVAGLMAFLAVLANRTGAGSAIVAAMLGAGFAAYTAVQIAQEGVVMFWTNHSQNLTGIQVWWDLIIAVILALFFIAPRARKAGMNLPLWGVLVVSTASIGLLAMCARLFWLENARADEAAKPGAA